MNGMKGNNISSQQNRIQLLKSCCTRGILYLLLFYSLVIPLFMLLLSQRRQARESILLQEDQLRISTVASEFRTTFDAVMGDAEYFAHSSTIVHYLSGQMDESYTANDFVSFALIRGVYDQIRLIDLAGQEIIRVNYSFKDGARLVPREELQNKMHRYYFDNALTLDPGELYISPLDLNIEHQQVELPFKPMIRLSTPVAGPDGEVEAVLVLNYLAQELIQLMSHFRVSDDNESMILNADGFWLYSSVPRDEWGFMFPEKEQTGFFSYFPALWEKIMLKGSGQMNMNGDYYTFQGLQFRPNPEMSPDLYLVHKSSGGIIRQALSNFYSAFYLVLAAGTIISLLLAYIHAIRIREGQTIRYMALHDSLTGLVNRKLLMDRLRQSLYSLSRRSRGLAVLFIDQDNFKSINDTLGHEAGDRYLQRFAATVKPLLRKSDTMARMGGDEFVILLEDVASRAEIEIVADKMFKAFRETKESTESDDLPPFSISMGAALALSGNEDPDTLLVHADKAMYYAKKNGKNRIAFWDEKSEEQKVHLV